MNGPNKLVFHYARLEMLARDKHSSLLGPFICYQGNEVLWILPQGPNSQHLILFIAYESAQYTRLLLSTKLQRLANDKQSNLLGPLICYQGNEVLGILPQGPYPQHLIFFITYESAQ